MLWRFGNILDHLNPPLITIYTHMTPQGVEHLIEAAKLIDGYPRRNSIVRKDESSMLIVPVLGEDNRSITDLNQALRIYLTCKQQDVQYQTDERVFQADYAIGQGKLDVISLPEFLPIALKRSGFQADALKHTHGIIVNDILDIPSDCLSDDSVKILYQLIGFIHHDDCNTGRSDTGHYAAFILGSEGWLLANDDKVEVIADGFRLKHQNSRTLYLFQKMANPE